MAHGFSRGACQHLSSVVDDAEICLVLQFLGFVEFGVRPLLLQDLLHKALVCGFGEPALLVQQSQDSWRTRLETQNTDYNQTKSSFGDLSTSAEEPNSGRSGNQTGFSIFKITDPKLSFPNFTPQDLSNTYTRKKLHSISRDHSW